MAADVLLDSEMAAVPVLATNGAGSKVLSVQPPPPPPPDADAVIVAPLRPKDTPLALLKTTALALVEVVPALTLMALMSPAVLGTVYDAVMRVDADMPNEIPLESMNATLPLVAV